jgi:nanoRNase/pAp phosphatase (c-di-AMP/oligoRNAs hydrolase)
MDPQQQQLIERIRQAQNILVTVSANPSVDQLSAAIGLTLALNKLEKHGTAVFSGQVPSTIEFLKPEATLEKNTDSLRDFIIALDKSKADKLRYKVEDQVVRIFITPYKTSLSQKDLDFSQGDFNVDVVVCLGVTEQQDLDTAITAHGRILHDATVVSVSTHGQGSLGSINWVDPAASSLSEMMVSLCEALDKKSLDNQIATALLTGIVANTERFRNEKTSPKTMSAAAQLMASGANQQLIATELETPPPAPEPLPVEQPNVSPEPAAPAEPEQSKKSEPGTLEIDHHNDEPATPAPEPEAEAEPEPAPEPEQPQVHVDEEGRLVTLGQEDNQLDAGLPEISRVRGVGFDGQPTEAGKSAVSHERVVEPPRLGDADLTANANPEELDPSTEELTLPPLDAPLLKHNESVLKPMATPLEPANPFIPQEPLPPAPAPFSLPPTPAPAAPLPSAFVPPAEPQLPPMPTPPPVQPPLPPSPSFADNSTLSEIEQSVDSPHLHSGPAGNVDDARSAVEAAFSNSGAPSSPLEPITALNANPFGPTLHDESSAQTPPNIPNTGFSEPTPGNTPADDTLDMPLPSNPFGPGQQLTPPTPAPFEPPMTSPAPAPLTPPTPMQPPLPPSAFPGMPQQTPGQPGGQTPPPPVPPPMLPPLQ